ncbi:hypothetical protein C8R47DRAFT_1320580 [Mycena vitilis]|nr:hypothetical protein C8R47DRAFT_1320580 [Mycena vitilis]
MVYHLSPVPRSLRMYNRPLCLRWSPAHLGLQPVAPRVVLLPALTSIVSGVAIAGGARAGPPAILAATTITEAAIAEAAIAETAIAETAIAETAIAETAIAETAIAETAIPVDIGGAIFSADLELVRNIEHHWHLHATWKNIATCNSIS